jgi:hypothetical protein
VEVRFLTDYFQEDDFRRRFLLDRFPALDIRTAPAEAASGAPIAREWQVPPTAVAEHLERHSAIVLDGHWQDEAYFFGQEADIRAALQPEMDPGRVELGRQLRAEGAIGVHVRRSEYGQLGLAKVSYYREAVQAIRNERGERRAVCFNDEPNFCAAVFHDTPNFIVTTGDFDNTLNDFYLLSRCEHFVIANSTFSWWAAWLGEGEGSIVYAPAPWCVISDADPIPPRWRRVDGAVQAQ